MDKIFKAFADKNRRLILTLLKEKVLSVNEIVQNMQVNQATVSNHLAILKKAKLISCDIDGKKRLYKINRDILELFVKELNRFFDIDMTVNGDELILRR